MRLPSKLSLLLLLTLKFRLINRKESVRARKKPKVSDTIDYVLRICYFLAHWGRQASVRLCFLPGIVCGAAALGVSTWCFRV